ncbi:hypothetical protein T02_5462 [Trichinella nativa]|uniref:Uncharacterized protein n=1 Tax=Trichinella nativa TaxID=6335 RepID=A0A0V1KNC0_9BILA|nr:hypothetical protein T02_5462 [Trichinella nativa]
MSTYDHFHPAYYTIYMHKWMGSSKNGKQWYVSDSHWTKEVASFLTHKYIRHAPADMWMENYSEIVTSIREQDSHVKSGASTSGHLAEPETDKEMDGPEDYGYEREGAGYGKSA